MKIVTYKCDVCGSTFSNKSEYISHLKEHVLMKKLTKESKQFCQNHKQSICDLFSNSDITKIEHNLYENYSLISEYLMKKYFLTTISSYQKYIIYKELYQKILGMKLNYQTFSEKENDDSYMFSFKTELGHIEVKHIYESNFGNGVSIKIIDKGSYGIKIVLTLKKQQHRLV